ncbi:LPS-assembly protein LptD [Ovoidimarina sediminis]|uniref:LPS-assembly protein LptD n=1 Tax=Ovoidimarina sediminis TaxID=3079856 RepID=UPI002908F93A|nr:LPS assembly protein LptD [Rhodophyticola sp. MJ-SS7]MDU8945655.1 LPS assembly protein LptD [Rhodophyticola sp. MJ-SS7]
MRRAALLIALALAWAVPAVAQEAPPAPASLVADRISIEGDRILIAEGSVEVLYDGAKLTARRVVYNREDETLQIDGPILLSEGGGESIILADSAELDATLRRGILRSARIVIDRQLQIAAAEIARVSGRYSRLSRVAASSCEVCEGGTPLWEIRAREVIRDETERQLYFDDAQFRFLGVPIAYFPRLRMPDPTLDRARGFLSPELRTRTQLGTGIRLGYFVPIGAHADLTFSPYISGRTTTLEARYRQVFRHGDILFNGAVSRDDIVPGDTRAYLFAEGGFDLPRNFELSFDVELVTDNSYLFDYGYSEKDRLDSNITVARIRDDQLFSAGITSFRTLRASEVPTARELPNELFEFGIRQRFAQDPSLGSLWGFIDVAALARPSDLPGVGRDVSRLSAGLDWQATHILPVGLVFEAEAEAAVDTYVVNEDPSFDSTLDRVRGGGAVTLRWPHERQMPGGPRHILEPAIQIAWSEASGDTVPNEDSTVVELDEGNLFSMSRFPGTDRYEEGLRVNYGVTWTRHDPDGWSIGATVGRIYRFDAPAQFGADTGLSGTSSDWLAAVTYNLADTFRVTSRSLIADNFDISRSETRAAYQGDRLYLAGSHLWRAAEPSENRFDDLSELAIDGSYRIDENWTAASEWRFDADTSNTTSAGLGLRFRNECLAVDLSLSRRFTSSSNVEPATELDLRISLAGFGGSSERQAARRKCRG